MANPGVAGAFHRRGIELEKFKRRMIRSVARRLKEKKTGDEVWEDMKKEIGSNCKKLWERMRMLTLKKLKRLLEAEDRIDLIGPVARMTLTDWLLFDLVIVHEKIDVINREKLTGDYSSKVLINLFALVQRFEIEGRTGDNLADAWTAATVYYNSKGHQCSPMMLQRRWYQIKELTRHKFYKFWFNYRGNQRQLSTAKQDSPDDLQQSIALKYPQIITQKFMNWEERIANRLVILPDELGVKMRQKTLMNASDTTAPDVVLVEQQIEVIDLGANSDSDEERELPNAHSKTQPPPFKIKSEPVDESETEHEIYIPPEKGSEFEEEIERLQRVEENFDENSMQDVDSSKDVVIEPDPTIADSVVDSPINDVPEKIDDNESGFTAVDANNVVSFSIVDGKVTNVEKRYDAIVIDDDDDHDVDDDTSAQRNASSDVVEKPETIVMLRDQVSIENDKHISHTANTYTADGRIDETADGLTKFVMPEISSVASAGVKVENLDDYIERAQVDELETETIRDNLPDKLFPVISTVSSAGIKVELNLNIENDTAVNDVAMELVEGNPTENVDQRVEISDVLPVIAAVSSKGIKVEIEMKRIEDNLQTEDSVVLKSDSEQYSSESNIVVADNSLNKSPETSVLTKGNDLEEFGDIPMDFDFAEEDIDFADDGIEYVEENEEEIITVKDPPPTILESAEQELKPKVEQKYEDQEQSNDEEDAEETIAQKFDLKLLMYPVVYTTKLDAMTVFHDTSQYAQVYDKQSIDTIYALSKPFSKQSVNMNTMCEQSIKQDEHNDDHVVHNDQVEVQNDLVHVNDDDLFMNETIKESSDSDSESDIIDASKRVKLTSYMLQKPKHRSYNPVLLCKNPDFNTRLKKLTVGFFMSARNRTLLQSCIPMTIDMSKSFEEKLIDGTLYLKPTPTDLAQPINIDDDVEMTSQALVKPSVVQQSLLNIDDTLESELKKRMAERVRAINLPDISQVRRLNQHLLTAEVTPLRLENETSDTNKLSSVTRATHKIGPACYIQKIKDDINNLLLHQKSKDVSDTESNINPIIPEKQPSPPLVPISNSVSAENPTPPLVYNNNPIPRVEPTPPMVNCPISREEPLPPPQAVSSYITTSNNTYPSYQPSIANRRGMPKTRKPIRRTIYPTIAWNKRPQSQNPVNQELHQTDALLTIDTLYKMLSALDPCTKVNEFFTQFQDVFPKKKTNKKKVAKPVNEIEQTKKEKQANKCTVIDITDDEVPAKKPKLNIKGRVRTKDKNFCCWCSYRISCIKGNIPEYVAKRRHRCNPKACVCCCRDLYYGGDLASLKMEPVQSEQNEQHISETIEHVVQLVNHTNEKPSSTDVGIQIHLEDDIVDDSDSALNNAVLTQTTNISLDSLSMNSYNDTSAELTPLCSSPSKQPTPKIRVYSGIPTKTSNTAQSTITTNDNITSCTKDELNAVNRKRNSNSANEHVITNILQRKPNLKTTRILANPCSCRPNISKVNRGKIEINGKNNNCPIHTKTKENKVVFSKKLVTNENQPFFVGKGKILLSNMRMPQKSEAPAIIVSPIVTDEPPQVKTVSLPAGVQVVLLPDQTLTYIIQPDVTLTPDECALLPQFLMAIQQQINAIGVTLPADHTVAKIDEVIDIDEIESSDNPEKSVVNKVDIDKHEELEKSPVNEVCDIEIDKVKKASENEDFEIKIDSVAEKMKDTDTSASEENTGARTADAIEKSETLVPEACNTEPNTENSSPDKKINESQSSNADEATNKKSLLSDLMEMSGIMEEDLAPPPIQTQIPQEPIILDTQNFVLHQQVPREKKTNVLSVPSLSPTKRKTQYTASNKSGCFELTAVTSFAELKYSCDNNGVFFKLDLESGNLTSINVCIQRFPKAKPHSEKSVIDLTDDPDISITGPTSSTSTVDLDPVTLNVEDEQSPPSKTQISTILQKKQRLIERLSNNLKPVNILQSKKHVARILKRNKTLLKDPQFTFYSKRKMDKIEAKIDLVDSDAPMEEEYLENSDDSSDDEPLIKKVHRKRSDVTAGHSIEPDQAVDKQDKEAPLNQTFEQHESLGEQDQLTGETPSCVGELEPSVHEHSDEVKNNANENSEDKSIEEHYEIAEHSDDRDLNEQEDDYSDKEDEEINYLNMPTEPVPTNLVLSGGALNAHNIPLNTKYGSDEDSQDEDCILGV